MTLSVSLAAVDLLTLSVLKFLLIVLALAAILTFLLVNALRSYIMTRLDFVDSAYTNGLQALHYLWASFYSGGTLNYTQMSIERLHLLDSFAKVALAALYVPVLVAYETAIGTTLSGKDKANFQQQMEILKRFVERGYKQFKDNRDSFQGMDFSADILAMVTPFEGRFQREIGMSEGQPK
jgi:hypothetical protein